MLQDHSETKKIIAINIDDIDDDDNDDDEIVHIKIETKIDIPINYYKLKWKSKLVQDKYPQKNKIDDLSHDLQQYQQKHKIKDENILSFFKFIDDEKDSVESNQNAQNSISFSIEKYFDYLKLNQMLKIKKMRKILIICAQRYINEIKDINFIIRKIKDHLSSQNDDENDTFMPYMEKVLSENINICLQNENFGDLPISLIHRIFSYNLENIDNDLLFNFINGSIKKRYYFFSFLNLQNLSDENIYSLQKILSNHEDSQIFKPYIQSDIETIIENRRLKEENKQLKEANTKLLSEKEILSKEHSSIWSILCSFTNLKIEIQPNFNLLKYAPLSLSEPLKAPGLICILNQGEERLYIVSQSSNDIYNVIDPKTNDYFSIYNNSFICFELPEKVNICGFKVFSAEYDFPKTFNIEIDGNIVSKVTEATELKEEKNQEMTLNINPQEGKVVKLVKTGPQWETNSSDANHICLKRFEILSKDPKYAKGVFETLVQNSENQDPHKCNVLNSACLYDLNSFHSTENRKQIATWKDEISWFQIEFTKGLAVISHCRINMYSEDHFLKNFKIIGSDDCNIPVDEWNELLLIKDNDHKSFDIYEFPKPSPPIRFVRLIKIEVKNPKYNYLAFYHLDFFGYYFQV